MKEIKGYTQDELNFIVQNYSILTRKELAERLDKSVNSIGYAVQVLGLTKQKHKPWTEDENNYLIEHYNDMTVAQLAHKLNRTTTSINAQRDRLGLIRNAAWSESELQFLKDNYLTMEHSEIGKKLNRTEGAVRAKCFDLKLFKKDLPWEEWEIDFIKQNYKEMTKNEIAEILHRSPDAIGLKASRQGIKKYPYHCNYHYFSKIDTEEKAYWLGFLTADGWISRNSETNSGAVGIELQYNDIGHLKKFNKAIDGNYQITDRWKPCMLSSSNKLSHTCCIRVFSIIMHDDLVKLGFSNEKSYTAQIPDLPQHLLRHYIRGYFDGDGCFSLSNKHLNIKFVTASLNLFNDLSNIMDKLNFATKKTSDIDEFNTVIYYIEMRFNNDKIKFLDYIYHNANIYLDRKYKKYLKAKEKYSTRDCLAS